MTSGSGALGAKADALVLGGGFDPETIDTAAVGVESVNLD